MSLCFTYKSKVKNFEKKNLPNLSFANSSNYYVLALFSHRLVIVCFHKGNIKAQDWYAAAIKPTNNILKTIFNIIINI